MNKLVITTTPDKIILTVYDQASKLEEITLEQGAIKILEQQKIELIRAHKVARRNVIEI
jgi:hypothetical protein